MCRGRNTKTRTGHNVNANTCVYVIKLKETLISISTQYQTNQRRLIGRAHFPHHRFDHLKKAQNVLCVCIVYTMESK